MSKALNKTWTEEEDIFLRENFPKTSRKECAEKLKRLPNEIKKRVKVLGICKIFISYSQEEDSFLIENYQKEGPLFCSQQLKREKGSIKSRAKKLNLLKVKGRWTKEEDELIIQNYNSMGRVWCAKQLRKNAPAVGERAKTLGVRKENKPWTKEDDDFIKIHFPTQGSRFCAEFLKREMHSIHDRCSTLNIKTVRRKLKVEKFIKMDMPESCYLAGMFWADAHISKKKNCTAISLLKTDMDQIVDLFKIFGEWGIVNPKKKDRKEQTYIYTYNKYLHDFLILMDYQNKSYVEPTKILNYIPEHLHCYFWRGFSDGDGCFHVNKKSHSFSASGNVQYKWVEMEKILNKIGISNYSICIEDRGEGRGLSSTKIHRKNEIIIWGEYIYQNYESDKIGFPRKFLKFKKIKEKQKPKISLIYLETQKEFLFDTIKEASKFLKYTACYLSKKIKEEAIFRGYKCSFKNSNGDFLLHNSVQ